MSDNEKKNEKEIKKDFKEEVEKENISKKDEFDNTSGEDTPIITEPIKSKKADNIPVLPEYDISKIKRKNKEKKKRKKDSQKLTKVDPGYCPKCGAYVGGFYSCPVCKAKMPHGTRLRVTQILTVILVVLGLLGISFYAQIDPAPYVDIGDLGPTYANGTITIKGNITNIDYREASDGSWKTLIFTVTDNTGSIDVKAYTETTEQMIEAHNTPAIGDQCEVRGSVYIKGEDMYLLLDASDYFKPIRIIDLEINATDLYNGFQSNKENYLGKRVKVNGTVSKIGSDYSYFDLDYQVRIYFPDYVRAFSPDTTLTIIKGDYVQVEGVVSEYYGQIEVLPSTLYDIEIITSGGGSQV
ncbi:MAG: hypothetical protein ACTSRZ_06185 [Promethearchaeota archaeon]